MSAAKSHDPRPRTAATRRDQEPCSDQTLPGRVTIRPQGVGCSRPKAKACPQAVRQPPAPRWAQGLSWGHQMEIRRGHPNGIPLLLEGLQVDRQEASCCLGWCADSWAPWDLWAPHHRGFRNGLGWCGNNQVLAEGVFLRPTRTEARQVPSPVPGTCVQSSTASILGHNIGLLENGPTGRSEIGESCHGSGDGTDVQVINEHWRRERIALATTDPMAVLRGE